MKLCSCCEIDKPESEYNKRGSKLQPYCKICQRKKAKQQYEKNKETQKKAIYEGRKKRREKSHEYMLELFKFGCVDCGITDPEVLEWDHITQDKKYDISKLLSEGSSKERMNKELAKCELVCANCHRKRTFSRQATYRTK